VHWVDMQRHCIQLPNTARDQRFARITPSLAAVTLILGLTLGLTLGTVRRGDLLVIQARYFQIYISVNLCCVMVYPCKSVG